MSPEKSIYAELDEIKYANTHTERSSIFQRQAREFFDKYQKPNLIAAARKEELDRRRRALLERRYAQQEQKPESQSSWRDTLSRLFKFRT